MLEIKNRFLCKVAERIRVDFDTYSPRSIVSTNVRSYLDLHFFLCENYMKLTLADFGDYFLFINFKVF